MAEIDLNDLAIKTDSLPDAWKMLLIDPVTGQPAKSVTIARFVELLTNKIPLATDNTNGLMSNENHLLVNRLNNPLGTGYIKITPGASHYSQLQFLFIGGVAPSMCAYSINAISLKNNAIPSIVKFNGSNMIKAYYRIIGSVTELYIQSESTGGNIVRLYQNENYNIETVNNLPTDTTEVQVSTFNTSATAPNALTDPILLNNNTLPPPPPPANCVPNNCISDSSSEQFAISPVSDSAGQEDSIPVRSEPQEQYVWSIDKIGKAVLELQEENKRLKQILNISDDSEVQQM